MNEIKTNKTHYSYKLVDIMAEDIKGAFMKRNCRN